MPSAPVELLVPVALGGTSPEQELRPDALGPGRVIGAGGPGGNFTRTRIETSPRQTRLPSRPGDPGGNFTRTRIETRRSAGAGSPRVARPWGELHQNKN